MKEHTIDLRKCLKVIKSTNSVLQIPALIRYVELFDHKWNGKPHLQFVSQYLKRCLKVKTKELSA